MTKLEILDNNLIVHVEGADKLWTLKSELRIPIQHISDITTDPTVARDWHTGLKVIGAHIPGVISAGTFYKNNEKVFWDVHSPEKSIIIWLRDENYHHLVIEVENPSDEINRIKPLIAS